MLPVPSVVTRPGVSEQSWSQENGLEVQELFRNLSFLFFSASLHETIVFLQSSPKGAQIHLGLIAVSKRFLPFCPVLCLAPLGAGWTQALVTQPWPRVFAQTALETATLQNRLGFLSSGSVQTPSVCLGSRCHRNCICLLFFFLRAWMG